MVWPIKHHSELTTHELYGILRLRNAVYIVELDKPVGDTDGMDLTGDTYHAMFVDDKPTEANATYDSTSKDGNVIAYVRLHWDKKANRMQFRRVVVAKNHRGSGLATELMHRAITWCRERAVSNIDLAARIHLQKFYESLGFDVVGEKYFLQEVQVWHVNMVKILDSLV